MRERSTGTGQGERRVACGASIFDLGPSIPSLLLALSFVFSPVTAEARRPFSCDDPQEHKAYHCLGATRAKARILEDLRKGRDIDDLALLAAHLDYREAVPLLRGILQSTPGRDVWDQEYVARALAGLGDRESGPLLLAMARRYETNNSALWQAMVEALIELDVPEAEEYARDLAKRTPMITETRHANQVRAILPILVDSGASDLLPLLKRWAEQTRPSSAGSSLHGRLNGACMELGDEKQRAFMRKALAQRNGIVPAWPDHYVGALGTHPDDVQALLRFASSTSPEARRAYDAIDRLSTLMKAKSKQPAWRNAKVGLISGLRKLTSYRENREHVQFEARQLARHHISLYRLGDNQAQKRLIELTSEPTSSVIPWLAADIGLEMGFPNAADNAARVMEQAPLGDPRIRWVRLKLLERAVTVMGAEDPRWAVLVLDNHPEVRRRALHHLARQRPAKACGLVLAAADGVAPNRASHDAVDDGLLALTTLGNRCRPELEKLMPRRDVHPRVWGVSLEILAMMESPRATEWATKVKFRRHLGTFAKRALAISKIQ